MTGSLLIFKDGDMLILLPILLGRIREGKEEEKGKLTRIRFPSRSVVVTAEEARGRH